MRDRCNTIVYARNTLGSVTISILIQNDCILISKIVSVLIHFPMMKKKLVMEIHALEKYKKFQDMYRLTLRNNKCNLKQVEKIEMFFEEPKISKTNFWPS